MVEVASAGRIDVISDAICPWCYIGKRHLERALDILENAHKLRFTVAWHPFQLNPDMPVEGVDRQKYRLAKFGSAERCKQMDERITEVAASVGIAFHLDRLTRTPNTLKARGELLSWMMFVASGVGPFAGQSVHFRNYAPEKLPYAINRYVFEAQRHFGILDARLAKQKYMLGDTYTIVDMNVWGWARLIPNVLGEGAWDKFKNLKRVVDEITARPAAQRALTLKDRHKFKSEMDQEALHAMFPHLKEKVA